MRLRKPKKKQREKMNNTRKVIEERRNGSFVVTRNTGRTT